MVDDKVRIAISVSPEINERIERVANKLGYSKSQLCQQLVIQNIGLYENLANVLNDKEQKKQLNDMLDDMYGLAKKYTNDEK